MKANKLFIYVALSLATLSLSSCHDWLTDGTPGVSHPEDYLTSGKALVELVNEIEGLFTKNQRRWLTMKCGHTSSKWASHCLFNHNNQFING